VFAKYNESITSRCIGTINISYKNDNTGKTARITKEIVIDKHSNHKYGGWEIGPSNNVQIRRCSVCGYAETNIIHSPTLPPTSTQSPTPTPVPTPSPTPVPTPDANNHAFVAKTTWNMNSVNHWHACNYPGCNMDAHYDLSNMPNEARFSTHKYGGWENGPSNDTQVRRCAVCGYTESQEIFSVSINPQACTIREGNTQILTVNVRGYGNDKVTKTFSTSNTSIATVNRNGIVTARSYGTAEITVRGQVNGTGKVKTAKCVINVECAHRRTEKYYIEESDTKHREVRRCLSCSTIIEPSEPLLRDHTWSGRWVVRDIDANEYTHVCTKCGAFGGGTRIGYIEGSTTKHAYCPSTEWQFNKEYHWLACVYPNCNMTSHKTIGNLPENAVCKKHAFNGSGADQNICSECGKTRQEVDNYGRVEPKPTPCIHNYIEVIYKYEPNPITPVDQPTSEGHYVEYKCEYCKQSDPDRPKARIPHSLLRHFVDTENIDKHICDVCNWESECQYDEDNIEYTLTATCLNAGYLFGYKKCSNCENKIEVYRHEEPALEHTSDRRSVNKSFHAYNGTYWVSEIASKSCRYSSDIESNGILKTDEEGRPNSNGVLYHSADDTSREDQWVHYSINWCYRCGGTYRSEYVACENSIEYYAIKNATHKRHCKVCDRKGEERHQSSGANYVKMVGDYSAATRVGNVSFTAEEIAPYCKTELPARSDQSGNDLKKGLHAVINMCRKCGQYFIDRSENHSWAVYEHKFTQVGDYQHKFKWVCAICNYLSDEIIEDCYSYRTTTEPVEDWDTCYDEEFCYCICERDLGLHEFWVD
jgi:uncharacterized protein YjdB